MQAPTHLLSGGAEVWSSWAKEMRWANGWPEFSGHPEETYRDLVRTGLFGFAEGEQGSVRIAGRLAAVEHLLDELDGDTATELADLINDRASFHRVGVRVEGRRFVPVTSEHMHTQVVQPSLLLLSQERFDSVDALYRKAFDRALSQDPSSAVTAATSAVEEMFRTILGLSGLDMDALANRARNDGVIPAAVHQFAVKLSAHRTVRIMREYT